MPPQAIQACRGEAVNLFGSVFQDNFHVDRRKYVASQRFFREGMLTDNYRITSMLGFGNFAEVRRAVHKHTGEEVAIKILPKNRLPLELILNEIEVMAKLHGHPHVIQLLEVYENARMVTIVMEFVRGGELFHQIVRRKRFCESEARDVIHAILATIQHMHTLGIVHRDIKPENVLLSSRKSIRSKIKIVDFGLAVQWRKEPLKGVCGSAFYIAPEMLHPRSRTLGYTPQCDMWSIGVLLYILLCGYPPFDHEDKAMLFHLISSGDIEFDEVWHLVSDSAKDLVMKLLIRDPDQRITPLEALNHPYMSSPGTCPLDQKELAEYTFDLSRRLFKMLTVTISAVNTFRIILIQSDRTPRRKLKTGSQHKFMRLPRAKLPTIRFPFCLSKSAVK